MTKVGFHKIIGQMFRGPLTLSEITKFSKLSKPTVHHHLQNLMKQEIVVYDKIKGKYSVAINEDLKKQILNCLRNERTFEQLKEDLIKVSKSEPTVKSTLKLLVKDKEFENKLNDLLEFLSEEKLVTEVSHYVLSGTVFKEKFRWTLAWKGSTRIGICHICKKEINSKVSSAVVQTIQTGDGHPAEFVDTLLIHPKCAILSNDQRETEILETYFHSNDLCDYCGLPFSETRIRALLKSDNDTDSFKLLYNLLSLDEIDALSKERRLELISRFKKEYDEEPPIEMLEGEVLLKEKFVLEIARGWIKFEAPKSFNFLTNPKFSDLEKLGKIIEKHTKRKFENKRLKELFEEWSKYHTKQEEKIDNMISSIFGTPMAKIYQKIWNSEPGPSNAIDKRPEYEDPEENESSLGFSFVIKDEENNQYHETCYQHLQNLKPTIQPTSEKTKRGSKFAEI